MTIAHHPSDMLLSAYAAGTLDQGCNALVATHLMACAACRAWTRSVETVGGMLLENVPQTPLADDAFARIAARLDQGKPETCNPVEAADNLPGLPGLPGFVRAAPAGRWQRVAPGLQLRRIELADAGETRVFLLRSKPGAKFIPHSHTGLEMTCVLTGSFSHDERRYGPGDFDLGDPNVDHIIEIGRETPCVSLVAMQGRLRLHGIVGKLMQPLLFI